MGLYTGMNWVLRDTDINIWYIYVHKKLLNSVDTIMLLLQKIRKTNMCVILNIHAVFSEFYSRYYFFNLHLDTELLIWGMGMVTRLVQCTVLWVLGLETNVILFKVNI